MAQKANPKILRMGITERPLSNWFATKKNFAKLLHQDRSIRTVINSLAKPAGIDKVVISRSSNNITIDLFVGRPGIAIGKGGTGIEMLEKAIVAKIKEKVKITVHEVKQPYLSAALVANAVSEGIARKIPPKVVMRQQIDKVEASGAKGARIIVKGMGPIKQSRSEKVEMKGGKIPLTTLRAKIDYARTEVMADKMFGIKVWIYKGEI